MLLCEGALVVSFCANNEAAGIQVGACVGGVGSSSEYCSVGKWGVCVR